jgi:large subunit ribosomal protein L23
MAKVATKKEKKGAKEGAVNKTMPHVLLRPRVTEKASQKAMEDNVYIFEIPKTATKREVKKAVTDFYKVVPVKIATIAIPRKEVFVRGKKGFTGGGKKAYVYLKKGDKIEFV